VCCPSVTFSLLPLYRFDLPADGLSAFTLCTSLSFSPCGYLLLVPQDQPDSQSYQYQKPEKFHVMPFVVVSIVLAVFQSKQYHTV